MDDYHASGLQCMAQGEFDQAIGWFEKALQHLDPAIIEPFPIVLFNLGDACANTARYALAIEYYLRSLIYAPHFDLTRAHLIACLEPCSASARQGEPDIAQLLVDFRDNMGWQGMLEDPSSIKQFLHFLKASRLCQADTIVLDISAGFCRNKPFFAHAEYVAIDLEVAEDWDFSSLDLIGDALNLPIKENSIDLIISSSSLEHYSNPFKAFHEFARVLKPGGALYLDVPFSYLEHQIPHDYFRFTRYGLSHLCTEHGLQVEEINPDRSMLGNSFVKFREALSAYDGVAEPLGRDFHKIVRDAIHYLDNVVKPIVNPIDVLDIKAGIGADIVNCSQFPVRYNLIASKPGKLDVPKHYSNRSALLEEIAECPGCHRSALDWQPGSCVCPLCHRSYSRNANGIPALRTD